ncbi:unnamed protein product, partial [Laminaria digitata]
MAARRDCLRAEHNERVTDRSCAKFCKKNDCSTSKVCGKYTDSSSSTTAAATASAAATAATGGGAARCRRLSGRSPPGQPSTKPTCRTFSTARGINK